MLEREVEEDSQMAAEKSRAVFVDTNLNTHLIVPIYSHSSVTSLKRQLRREHFECFPELGRIEINALSVKLNDSHYHLPDYMLLKTAFHGVADAWFVFADVWTPGSCLKPQKDIECKPLEARLWHQNELQLVKSSPQPHVTLDMSSSKKKKKKKKRKERNNEGNVENNNGGVKEQEKTRGSDQLDVPKADKVSATKQLHKPSEGLHYTSVVHPSVMHLKDGGDNTVKYLQKGAGMVHQLEGTSTSLAEVLNKESGIDTSLPKPRFKKTKKTKSNIRVNNSPAATSNQEPDILEKGDAPSDNKHTIYKEGIKIAEEVPPSQLNNVSELLFQHDPLKIEKETVEDVAPLKSDNAAKKRKRDRSGQERTAEKVTPLHLNNVPELLLPQKESMNLVDREKEIEEDIAPENPAKRRKRNISKNSGTENQELLSKRQIADQKEDDMRTCLPDDTSRPEMCVETISKTPKKRSQNEEAVPEKDSQEEIQKLEAPVTVTQSDKPKKQRQKKQPAPTLDPSSLSVDHHLDEITMEMEAPKKADAILTTCNAITNDDLLKSVNNAKKSKTNESEQEHRTAAKVSQSHLNIAPDFSQNESVNFAEREKEMKEVVSPSKSEHSRKKKKERRDSQLKKKEISVLTESSKMQNDIDKPEESKETMSKSLKKRSLNEETISSRVPPGSLLKEKPDEETRERATPYTVIESDKPLTRSHRKKLSVSGKDLSSLAGKQQSAEKKMEMDAPKSVEEADDAKIQKKVIQAEVHHDDSREVPSLTVSSVLSESKHLEKSWTRKQKAKKHDQPSAVDTSFNGQNLAESKKNQVLAKTSEIQKLSTVQGQDKPIPPRTDLPVAAPTKTNKKGDVSLASVDDGSRISGKIIMRETDAPRRVDQADDLFTDAESNGAQEHKEVIEDDEHGEFSQAPRLEDSTVLADAAQLEKPQASKQKVKKLDQPSSIDTSSNGRDLLGLKKNKGSSNTSELLKPITDKKHDKFSLNVKNSEILKEVNSIVADPTSISRNIGVSRASLDDGSKSSEVLNMSFGNTVKKIRERGRAKEPPKRLEDNSVGIRKSSLLSTKQTKKGLASSKAIFDDGTSSSSDDEDRTSSSVTIPPDNLSSSDYSEGESEGVVISQPDSSNGNERSKANSSGSKLESILRSSSRYKKAKLVASQSQNDSELPEFVPDSLADV
ncbi:uncharacterized protein LOC110712566 [Chenopodium quinoa]|uniref:uncharacterized protein LOC110712566 n=1 Tax=Chenopodium quinoa TaxID=63459 RepID=UPI000B780166|nr:uncharacterized protein LOC110712566 [Chenopodium quinoa]